MLKAKKYDTFDFYNKVNLIQYFYENRDRNLIPPNGYDFALQQQKFLFFYNMFCKVKNKSYSVENLKAFKNGPVYNDVYYEYKQLPRGAYLTNITLPNHNYTVETDVADAVIAMISCMSASDISERTHRLDLWDSVYNDKNRSNDILESDISDEDLESSEEYLEFFETISKEYILQKGNSNIFAIKKEDYSNILWEHWVELSQIKASYNPIMVEIDEETGEMVCD